MERDFSDRGVQFVYVYKALAHPETNGYVTPFNLEERLQHVAEAKEKLGTRVRWLCDSMDNSLKHALGDAPNSEFIIDPNGKFLVVRRWSDPEQLRLDLEQLVGKPTKRTTVEEIGMEPLAPPETAPTGIVDRVELPPRMVALKIEPGFSAEPFYAKLRAEIEPTFVRSGEGTLYLGFFLDPLYEVHWNNQADPIRIQLKHNEDLSLSATELEGPSVEEEADADPREFLIQLSGRTRSPIELTVSYFACDDAQTFCKPVTQSYKIYLERDSDGGTRRSFEQGPNGQRPGRARMGNTRRGPQARRGARRANQGRGIQGRGMQGRGMRGQSDTSDSESDKAERTREEQLSIQSLRTAVRVFRQFDLNEDGKLASDEFKNDDQLFANSDFSEIDADSNDAISLQELVDWLKTKNK